MKQAVLTIFYEEALLHFSHIRSPLTLGKKDLVLNYEAMLDQVNGTEVHKIELPDGHMSHIENQQEVISALQEFVKGC